jgi:CBS domain-containing protein
MGKHDASACFDEQELRAFTQALLRDLHTLERMLAEDRFERGVRRIGAEQEMFLVDRACRPAPCATEVLQRLEHPQITTELARFNLEANLTPLPFGGDCLRRMENELEELLALVRGAARESHAAVLLTGILPTLELGDLTMANMAPVPRYALLDKAMRRLRGGRFRFRIQGLDELDITHDNVMLESCNTSFQVHFQVDPVEFARLYNVAQAITAPVLAAAANSPILLGRRLWAETRVALFQQSVDARSDTQQARGDRSRVSFGDGWVRESVLEIFREDVARFRVVLAADSAENSEALLAAGEAPRLPALRLHNGTVYRWNRPCYGISDGKPHLRIENRVLPAGPTVLDELGNAALYFGLMAGMLEEQGPVEDLLSFDDAKANFTQAARVGLDARLRWFGGTVWSASALLLAELLPLARRGLERRGIAAADIERYLDVVEERVRCGRTGARWTLDSLAALGGERKLHQRVRAVTGAMLGRQESGRPVHEWALAASADGRDWRDGYRTVGQYMTTDLFTVRPGDIVDLAANLMEWEHIRHVPVEDDDGKLVGLVSHRALLRLVARGQRQGGAPVAVAAIMKRDPITVGPHTATLDAIKLMREHRVGCLPVVSEQRLVGIITERDLIDVAARLFEEHLREAEQE